MRGCALVLAAGLLVIASVLLAVSGYDPALKWLLVFSALFLWVGADAEEWAHKHRRLVIGIALALAVGAWMVFVLGGNANLGIMLILLASVVVVPELVRRPT